MGEKGKRETRGEEVGGRKKSGRGGQDSIMCFLQSCEVCFVFLTVPADLLVLIPYFSVLYGISSLPSSFGLHVGV